MKNWSDWKQINKNRIAHPAGFEERFIDDILSKIDIICPSDVHSQVHFLDTKGCNRYIDFVVVNKNEGWNLPIELDGYSKITDGGHRKWNDFLERQNALIAKFGTLLRYSNKQMLDTPEFVRKEIEGALRAQSSVKARDVSQREAREKIIQNYEDKLRDSANESVDSREIKSEIQEIKAQLGSLKATGASSAISKPAIKWPYAVVGILLLASAATLFFQKQEGIESRTKTVAEASAIENKKIESTTVVAKAAGSELREKEDATAFAKPVSKETKSREISSGNADFVRLPASEAANYVNQNGIYFCGRIAKATEFSKGVYLNFDRPFPNQSLTGLVWNDRRHVIENLTLEGRDWCITGTVTEFKGHPQIVIQARDQLINAD